MFEEKKKLALRASVFFYSKQLMMSLHLHNFQFHKQHVLFLSNWKTRVLFLSSGPLWEIELGMNQTWIFSDSMAFQEFSFDLSQKNFVLFFFSIKHKNHIENVIKIIVYRKLCGTAP